MTNKSIKISKIAAIERIHTSLIIFTLSRNFPSFLAHIASLLLIYTRTFVSLPTKKKKKIISKLTSNVRNKSEPNYYHSMIFFQSEGPHIFMSLLFLFFFVCVC